MKNVVSYNYECFIADAVNRVGLKVNFFFLSEMELIEIIFVLNSFTF